MATYKDAVRMFMGKRPAKPQPPVSSILTRPVQRPTRTAIVTRRRDQREGR